MPWTVFLASKISNKQDFHLMLKFHNYYEISVSFPVYILIVLWLEDSSLEAFICDVLDNYSGGHLPAWTLADCICLDSTPIPIHLVELLPTASVLLDNVLTVWISATWYLSVHLPMAQSCCERKLWLQFICRTEEYLVFSWTLYLDFLSWCLRYFWDDHVWDRNNFCHGIKNWKNKRGYMPKAILLRQISITGFI